ncbi:MAG: TetR family transcriptional regulator [Hyphomicrobiaceae bacterium]
MLDLNTEKGRFISAALALAAETSWDSVTLSDIASRAGTNLVALKAHFASKSEILAAFTDLVNDEVLSRAPARDEVQAKRDALFEVVMSRFDVLAPWKPALRSIAANRPPDPAQVARGLAANRWMLEAAGIGSGGLDGMTRVAGLASVYTAVFRIWLEDEDPGLARTMAALDRRLRRGERALRRADDMMSGMRRVAGAFCGAARGMRARAGEARNRGDRDEGGEFREEPSTPAA